VLDEEKIAFHLNCSRFTDVQLIELGRRWQIEAGLVNTGASVAIEGVLVESQGSKQKVELKATKLTLVSGFTFLSWSMHVHLTLSCLASLGSFRVQYLLWLLRLLL
jgi:aspartyl/asparaginyl-tRNA synthetase